MASAKDSHRKGAADPAPQAAAQGAGGETAGKVLRQFRVVFNAVKTHLQQVEKAVGIGGAQVWALGIIATRPGVGVSELAQAMDIHQSTASNLVKSLIGRELALAAKDGFDRRTVQLRVTPAGRRLLRNAPVPLAGGLPQALARLDQATLARLEQDLSLLIAELDTDAAANPPR
jgi:DNA-binding MarR family transcriptional regulator